MRLASAACVAVMALSLQAADTNAVINAWLSAQTNLQTWSAVCIQTRTFKTLVQPLVSTGQVWYAAPDRFRWELGQPPQTLAIREGDLLTVIYPRLHRAEEYRLAALQSGPWRDALALLDAGFPRDRAQVDRQFRVRSLTQTQDVWELSLQPASAAARRFIEGVAVAFSTNAFSLRATELTFADGSRMRNDFLQAVVNQPIPTDRFRANLEPGTTLVQPLKP